MVIARSPKQESESQPELEPAEQPESHFVEMSLYFYNDEIDQMDEDAAFLIRKGIVRLNGSSRTSRVEAVIRYATLNHIHKAIQKLLQSDFEAVDQARETLNNLTALKILYERKKTELEQLEAEARASKEQSEAIVTRYLAHLRAIGALEEKDG